jgi:DNA-binding NarL/FixJ family response regulator
MSLMLHTFLVDVATTHRQPAVPPPIGVDDRRLRVLVVDDQEVVHWGFKTLLARRTWVEGYCAASNTGEALDLAAQERPHVALVGAVVGFDSGADITRQLHEVSPETRVLLMASGGRISARAARAAGAFGFVPKHWPAQDIANAARMVGLGMTVFAPDADGDGAMLSDRERQVLEMIASGSTNREIAERLVLSPHTVKDHTSALYRKIGARNRAQAILRAQRLGILG